MQADVGKDRNLGCQFAGVLEGAWYNLTLSKVSFPVSCQDRQTGTAMFTNFHRGGPSS